MQSWNWLFLATAVVVASRDISTLPECMQECMLTENKHFDVLEAPKKRICKKYSFSKTKFWIWHGRDFIPCTQRQCDLDKYEMADAFDAWYRDLCGHGFSRGRDDD